MNSTTQPGYSSPARQHPTQPHPAHQHPVTQSIEATVTAFGHVQPSRYSNEQVQSVLFERWDHQDDSRKIWKTFPVTEARQFRKGQTVLLRPIQQGKRQGWQVERLGTPPMGSPPPYPPKSDYQQPEPEPTAPAGAAPAFGGSPGALYFAESSRTPTPLPSLSQTQALTDWIAQQADLYACCLSEAQRALSPQVPQETLRACASSLFISAMRKFRLEQ